LISLVFLESRLRVSYRTPLSGCAHDSGTGGGSGVFRWADKIGIPVRLLDAPLWEAPHALARPEGNCILTMGDGPWSPTGGTLDPASWVMTREWVAHGNTLILVTAEPAALPPEMRKDLLPSTINETAQSRSLTERPSVDNRLEARRAHVISGGALSVDVNGPRWNVSSSGAAAAAATTGSKTASATDAAAWQLAADGRGGVLFRIPVRRGAVYVLLDDFAWTNAGFDQADNAKVLAEILGRELRGGVLALDEYRHGHGRAESFLVYLSNLPGLSALLWLGLIWAILYYYGRNVRLKPVEAYLDHERRTAQEYIDAVAHLYERARAAPLVVEAVARRLRQLSLTKAECPPSVEALLQAAGDYVKQEERPAFPTAAIALVKQLIQLRKKIYGTRAAS
jgi:hypothetical protein